MPANCAMKCGRSLLPHSRLHTCATCRQSMGYYLRERTDAQIEDRLEKLNLYTRRVKNVKGHSRKTW